MELVLLCGLLVMAGMTPTQGGVLNLNKMIRQVTGKRLIFNYWPYGCHCGLGGRGEPKDATDRCCQEHDCCYSLLKTQRCRSHTDNYKYTFHLGDVKCSDKGSWCERQLCACDKAVAFCLKNSLDTYQKKLRFYWRPKCKGLPALWELPGPRPHPHPHLPRCHLGQVTRKVQLCQCLAPFL